MAVHNWRIPPDIFHRFHQLILQLSEQDPHTDLYAATLDDIRRLPGFPNNWDERNDEITIEATSPKQSSIPTPILVRKPKSVIHLH